MFTITEKIFDKWADKQPFMNDKSKLAMCAKFHHKNILDAIKYFNNCYKQQRNCCICGKKTAYYHGRFKNDIVVYHCIGLCGDKV
jgi:hypothetical protein